jgi:gamma-glutamyl phosphate reductase
MCRPKQKLSSDERKKILLDIADALEANEDLIRSENEMDVEAAQDAGYEKSLVARMRLKPGKVSLLLNVLTICSFCSYELFNLLFFIEHMYR